MDRGVSNFPWPGRWCDASFRRRFEQCYGQRAQAGGPGENRRRTAIGRDLLGRQYFAFGGKTRYDAFSTSIRVERARIALSYLELRNGAAAAPADMAAFTPAADAKPATNVFRGRLSFGAERAGGILHVLKDAFGDVDANNGAARHLPNFDFAFVQSGNALIPERRGAIRDSNAEWEFILEPGRVWDKPADRGLTRAVIPFALEERNANCMHNGMATFLFGKNGSVSDVAYEIAGETCFYFKFDMWGRAAAAYHPAQLRTKPGSPHHMRARLRRGCRCTPSKRWRAIFLAPMRPNSVHPRKCRRAT